jgi:3'(2'), 5'-bisphosphate nucleotidase
VDEIPERAAGSAGGRNDHEGARELAEAAGALLLRIRKGLIEGASPEEVRQAGDRESHELLAALLRRDFPDDAVLSEEAADSDQSIASERLWIIDPLDGTREFGELDRDDWAVHVALVERGELRAGAVALPAQGITYGSEPAPRPTNPGPRRVRIAVSRTRPPVEAQQLATRVDGELVPMGSAGAKAMAVISGEVDVYLHSGGQHVWDSAAPVAVALAAGLHASRIDGSELDYGTDQTWLPDLLICRSELRERVLGELRALAS